MTNNNIRFQVEEEIQTLRHVLANKIKVSQDLKRKLGISVWKELSDDVNQGLKNVKESHVYVCYQLLASFAFLLSVHSSAISLIYYSFICTLSYFLCKVEVDGKNREMIKELQNICEIFSNLLHEIFHRRFLRNARSMFFDFLFLF